MQVKQVQKKQILSRKEFIQIQIQIWCTLNRKVISSTILDLLVILAQLGEVELSDFCRMLCSKASTRKNAVLFTSEQSARNTTKQAIKEGFITQRHKEHTIKISDDLKLLIDSGTLLNLQLLCYEANQG